MTSGESSGPEKTQAEEAVAEQQEEKEAASASGGGTGSAEKGPADDPEAAEEDTEALKAQLAQAEKEAAEAKIRAHAELDNLRKRLEREKDNAVKFSLEKFAAELLNVADSLERALESLDRENEALAPAIEGTELTLKQLMETFRKFSIEQINPEGEPFNPEFHEAMTMVPNPDMEPNTVMEVIQPGYTLNGRLIRAARVVVSKAP